MYLCTKKKQNIKTLSLFLLNMGMLFKHISYREINLYGVYILCVLNFPKLKKRFLKTRSNLLILNCINYTVCNWIIFKYKLLYYLYSMYALLCKHCTYS